VAAADVRYRITGGAPAVGGVRCAGAKNAATKLMVAALLAGGPSTLSNVPAIGDIDITRQLLEGVGAVVGGPDSSGVVHIDPSRLQDASVPLPQSGSNRIPILLLSALLHRFDRVCVPLVGGCEIGARKVDFHLDALAAFGAEVEQTADGYVATRRQRLQGTEFRLPYPSVGATETLLYLSVLAQGRTTVHNAAVEPEIGELITMLRSMGAVIFTHPDRRITIEGVEQLSGTVMTVLGDRVEAGSWACLAAASDGDLTVEGVRPDVLGNFLSYFTAVGGGVELLDTEVVRFTRARPLDATVVETDVYPGFSTDWQQPFAVVLTQASGLSVLHETVYEKRLGYLGALGLMGAATQVYDSCLGTGECRFVHASFPHSAVIRGPTPLSAAGRLVVPDLRGGLAYVIAAAVATGATELSGCRLLERGYGRLDQRLAALGVDVERHLDPAPATVMESAG